MLSLMEPERSTGSCPPSPPCYAGTCAGSDAVAARPIGSLHPAAGRISPADSHRCSSPHLRPPPGRSCDLASAPGKNSGGRGGRGGSGRRR
uniref:Uncharacterized protein n=1 Tax=Anguilla anguilla TaxID=7936 RepID=A0A0E9U2W6_ANGAN